MPPITFRCPGCATARSSATAYEPGKLVDCPKCRLLFTPFEEDLKIPRGRADELALERRWSDGEVRGPYPSSSPWGWKRRYQDLGPILQAVLIVGAGVLLVGGVALGIYLSMGRSPVPVAVRPMTQLAPPEEPISPAPTPVDPTPTVAAKAEKRSAPTDASHTSHPLVGDWIGTGDSAEWAGIGPVAGLTFQPDGKAVVRTGSGLEVTSFTGTWKPMGREGDKTRVRLDLGGVMEMIVEFADNDTVHVTVKDKSATFRRP
jgi:hypothetical protein